MKSCPNRTWGPSSRRYRRVRWGGDRRSRPAGLPPLPRDPPEDAEEPCHRQVQPLADGNGFAGVELHLQGRQLVVLDQREADRLVVAALVPDEEVQDAAQVRFLPEDDAERTQRGQPAVLRQPQSEVLAAGVSGRQLQEPRGGNHGNPPIRHGEVVQVEPGPGHLPYRVEAERPRQLDVTVEGRGPDRRLHGSHLPRVLRR